MKTIRSMLTSHHFWRGAAIAEAFYVLGCLILGNGRGSVTGLCIGLVAGLLAAELEWRERRRRPQARAWLVTDVADPTAPTVAELDAGVEITGDVRLGSEDPKP